MEEDIDHVKLLSYYKRNISSNPIVCYSSSLVTSSNFDRQNPFAYTIPLFILQVLITIAVSRFVAFLIQPFRQPRYVSEIIGGFILGPSVLGRIPQFNYFLFPLRSLIIIDTFAQFGSIYFFFTLGVEGEKYMAMRKNLKTWTISISCVFSSFTLGALAGLGIHSFLHEHTSTVAFLTFLGFAMADNSFHDLVCILSELKLINSETGRLALSASMITHLIVWTVLMFSISYGQTSGGLTCLYSFLSGVSFFHLTMATVKPMMRWMVIKLDGREVTQMHINIILLGVMVWAVLAEMIGTHHIIGALAFGLSIPNGPLSESLAGRVEDFINGLFTPLVFLINGMRMDFGRINSIAGIALMVVVIMAGAALKVVITVLLAILYNMPPREGMVLGILMNVKGSIDVMILGIGSSRRMLGDQSFTIIVVTTVLLATLVTPLLKVVMKPSEHIATYRRRTVWWPNTESELLFLACVHFPRQAPGLASFLQIVHPTKRSPIFVYALHLIELNVRTTTVLLNSVSSKVDDGHRCNIVQSNVGGNSDIFHPFQSLYECTNGVSVQFLTGVSPYATMDEDVVSAAKDRNVALILLCFHKRVAVDGSLSPDHPAMRNINRKILDTSPCSVGIVVDRGLANYGGPRRVMLLFLGGPDDREGIALASRMAEHENPAVSVTVIRFLEAHKATRSPASAGRQSQTPDRPVLEDEDYHKDDECIAEFRARRQGEMVRYGEKVISNAEELVAELRALDGAQDLYVVGRGNGKEYSPMTAGLAQWSECPELGVIGDLLASPDFGSKASVLVLQQGGVEVHSDMRDPLIRRRHLNNSHQRNSMSEQNV